jgi:hypothetical protein
MDSKEATSPEIAKVPTPSKDGTYHILSAEQVLRHLENTPTGEHNILVYPELECFRSVYPKYCKTLLEDNDIVILLPYYEEIRNIRSFLNKEGIDTLKEEGKGNLVIVDAVREFFGADKDILLFFLNLERMLKKLGKKRLSVIVCMGVFHHYGEKIEEMLEYENLLDLSNVRNWKILCCYDERDFVRLTEEQRAELMSRHCRRIFCVGSDSNEANGNTAIGSV